MPDALNKIYDDWLKKQKDPTEFQIFQAGFTAAAVSMRQRALKAAHDNKDRNVIINAIGALPDIP